MISGTAAADSTRGRDLGAAPRAAFRPLPCLLSRVPSHLACIAAGCLVAVSSAKRVCLVAAGNHGTGW